MKQYDNRKNVHLLQLLVPQWYCNVWWVFLFPYLRKSYLFARSCSNLTEVDRNSWNAQSFTATTTAHLIHMYSNRGAQKCEQIDIFTPYFPHPRPAWPRQHLATCKHYASRSYYLWLFVPPFLGIYARRVVQVIWSRRHIINVYILRYLQYIFILNEESSACLCKIYHEEKFSYSRYITNLRRSHY